LLSGEALSVISDLLCVQQEFDLKGEFLMKMMTSALLGILFAFSLMAAPAAKTKKDCCNGASYCRGQACCRK
jgi:hypothetical protein